MIDKNDYFETSEDDFTEQKEEEISLEDERTGTIKNSKIKIEEFFDKKKVAILVCIILTLIFVSIYFANQAKKNEKPKEQEKMESISTGTGLDIKDAVDTQNQNAQTPESVTQDGVANINTTTDGTGTPNLSQYDSQLGSEYNNDNLDSNYGSSSSSFSDISEDKNSNSSAVSEEKSKEWRKSAIGFDKGVSTQTPQTTEQYQEQQQVPQNVQQQNENDTDQNKQKSKSLFLKQKQDSFYLTNLKNPAIGKYELKTGSFIPAVLVTAINSDLPGDVIAQVRENVYDYRTGKYILIPMGTKIVGKYDSSITYGQNRISTFISDIKKENYVLTSWYRAKILKHRILKFEPMSELSNSYNFLSEVRYGTNYEIEDCRIIGTMIVGEDESKDPFWGDSAKDTISTLTGYVHYREVSSRPEEDPDITDVRVSLNDVISIITNTENSLYRMFAKYLGKPMEEDEYEDEVSKDFILKEKTIERLRKIYTDEESIKALNKGLHPFVAKQFGYLLQNTGENTFKSITSTAKTKLQVFEIPSVVKNIEKSDFRAMDLVNGDNPVDLYFVIKPKDIDLLAPLVRIMYIQLTNLLMESLSKKNFNIIFLMDELNAYGKMKALVKGLGYYAGFGIKMVGIFQGLDQLNSTYDKQGKEVLNGCQIQIFGRPNDEAAPDYISKTLGKETIRVKSRNIGLKGGGNVSEQGKDLLSPSEIRLLPDRKAVVITGYKKPLLLDKLYYYEYPELLKRTQHQPVFFKDGYVIFEAMKGMYEYRHSFKMKEEDFYDDIKYEKIIEKVRKKYKSEKIG